MSVVFAALRRLEDKFDTLHETLARLDRLVLDIREEMKRQGHR